MENDLMKLVESYASALVGPITPFLVQLLRKRLPEMTAQTTQFLALVIATLCVSVVYFLVDSTPTRPEFIASLGLGFTLQQVAYRALQPALKEGDGK